MKYESPPLRGTDHLLQDHERERILVERIKNLAKMCSAESVQPFLNLIGLVYLRPQSSSDQR